MAFSSFPAIYFDHANLQQFQHQQDHHQHGSSERSQIQLPSPIEGVAGGASPHGGSSIRAGSMIDLARIAQLPLPEAGLKCPRCDSSNTKFCYYNNYNLLQPRYMCKTCRRYWTKGGALRKVPFGGGCRKNKKTKSSSSSSKPSTVSSDMQMGANSTGTKAPYSTTLTSNFPQFPLMAAGGSPIRSNLGSRFPANMGFSLGSNFGGNAINDLSSVGVAETWRLSLIPGYMGEGINGAFSSSMIGNQQLAGSMAANSTGVSRDSNGKSEESPTENITREFYINSDNCQFWGDHENPWIGVFRS